MAPFITSQKSALVIACLSNDPTVKGCSTAEIVDKAPADITLLYCCVAGRKSLLAQFRCFTSAELNDINELLCAFWRMASVPSFLKIIWGWRRHAVL